MIIGTIMELRLSCASSALHVRIVQTRRMEYTFTRHIEYAIAVFVGGRALVEIRGERHPAAQGQALGFKRVACIHKTHDRLQRAQRVAASSRSASSVPVSRR